MDSVIKNLIVKRIPPLAADSYKGELGRIGVIGGCEEYTGSPFFSAISSLRLGADLVHVFCQDQAAVVLKSYSPDLIVHGCLGTNGNLEKFKHWLERMKVLIIGPGAGRDQWMEDALHVALQVVREKEMPIVVDADGLYFLGKNLQYIKEYKKAILTPNKVEYDRLCEAVGLEKSSDIKELAKALGGVTILRKGKVDQISNGSNVLECSVEGSQRRVGGQGDLLSGCLGTFMSWFHAPISSQNLNKEEVEKWSEEILSAYAGACLTRHCSKLGFEEFGRHMITSDLLMKLPKAYQTLFSLDSKK